MFSGAQCRGVLTRLRALWRSRRANVAMMFALSLIPITVAAGAGVDLARALVVRTRLAEALDAAGLAVGSGSGMTQAQMQTLAQEFFSANYTADHSLGIPANVVVVTSAQTVTLSTSVSMPTTLMNVVGIASLNVGYSSQITWGQSKLWVSLVLDNTGSMTQGSPTSKISALKTATNQLLTILQNAATHPGDVQVALVPFSKNVNLGSSYLSSTWIDWTNFNAAPPNSVPAASVGPSSACPYATNKSPYGYACTSSPANGASTVTTIPSSGTYKGYICPGVDNGNYNTGQIGHYYNGCYTSVQINCSPSCTYTHTWVANAQNTWDGCIMDRNQSYDVGNTAPTNITTDFPAENDQSCPPAALSPLSYNWTALATEVNAMTANGSTDQPVGLAWGWQAQTSGAPLSAPTLPALTQQIIIIVSDGLNTQDRWYGDGSNQATQVDARMNLVCANAKTAGFIIYAVYVDLGGTQGNSTVLQNCATDANHYFDLTTSGEIVSTFNQIAIQITQLRVSK
jgi:Flp pilus assembly protein TadG